MDKKISQPLATYTSNELIPHPKKANHVFPYFFRLKKRLLEAIIVPPPTPNKMGGDLNLVVTEISQHFFHFIHKTVNNFPLYFRPLVCPCVTRYLPVP